MDLRRPHHLLAVYGIRVGFDHMVVLFDVYLERQSAQRRLERAFFRIAVRVLLLDLEQALLHDTQTVDHQLHVCMSKRIFKQQNKSRLVFKFENL